MSQKKTHISINGEEFSISHRFTYILGDFGIDDIKDYQKSTKFKAIEDFSLMKLETFIEIVKIFDDSFNESLTNINLLVDFLKSFQDTAKNNIQLLSRFINSLNTVTELMDYIHLTRKIEKLQEELELSKIKHKSSQLSAKTNLLNKLNEELAQNKKEFNYLKEDFLKIKNQREQILTEVNTYKKKIDELNKLKKNKFNKINQITRSMEKESPEDQDKLDIGLNLSNAEMIKKLRQEAKDVHYKIKKMRNELKETQMKLDKFTPKYQTIRDDYNSLKETINRQESQIKGVKEDINQLMEQDKDEQLKNLKINKFPSIRNSETIQGELDQIENKISRLKRNLDSDFDSENIEEKIAILDKAMKELLEKIKSKKKSFKLKQKKEELISAVENLRQIDLLLKNIEELANKLLKEIDISVDLQLSIANTSLTFFINPVFTRRNKGGLDFKDLTTPEKVFFTIILYLSIHMILNNKNIFFSNLFLHENFNKRGSLFRTFRKTIPVIEDSPELKNYNFIILISKLPMKRSPDNKNIKVINLTK